MQELIDAMQWFVDRCEKGEVRSKRTYARYKELLEKYKNQKIGWIMLTPSDNIEDEQLSVESRTITDMQMYEATTNLSRFYAQRLVKEAESVLNTKDRESIEAYLDFLIQNKIGH